MEVHIYVRPLRAAVLAVLGFMLCLKWVFCHKSERIENRTISPAPPLLAGINWRAIGRDDLGALVDLAAECQVVDGGLAFLNEPGNVEERYFSEAAGAAIGAFTADERLVACSTVHVAWERDMECARIVGRLCFPQ